MAVPASPNYHPDKISDGYLTFLVVCGIFTFFSLLCVILRFIQRRVTRLFGWDDWTILASLVFPFGLMTTTALVATLGGAGYHITSYRLDQLETYIKICLANNVIYNLDLGVILVANCAAAVGGLIFANSPVEGQWNLAIPSTPINGKPFWITMGVINLILDVVILVIPQFRVWRLKLSQRRRIAISFVFLLGGFVCIASLVRIVYFTKILVTDVTYEFTIPGIWTCVEMNMSIICACLPVIYSLFRTSKASQKSGVGMNQANQPSYPQISNDKYMNLETGSSHTGGQGGYRVKMQSTTNTDVSDEMLPLGPIRVDRVYRVS